MRKVDPPPRLDEVSLRRGTAVLSGHDKDLKRIVDLHGPPPLWAREPGLATLIRIILEQQVSLASGAAIYTRIEKEIGEVAAGSILEVGEDGLRDIGVTRQKASYCLAAAGAERKGLLDFERIARMSVDKARGELVQVKGVGRWTADVYLLMAECRPDVWPIGDIALQTAMQHLRGLKTRPNADEAATEAIRWAPWRAVAARILWHGYLSGSLRRPAPYRASDHESG